jgi:hypothetical protein
MDLIDKSMIIFFFPLELVLKIKYKLIRVICMIFPVCWFLISIIPYGIIFFSLLIIDTIIKVWNYN